MRLKSGRVQMSHRNEFSSGSSPTRKPAIADPYCQGGTSPPQPVSDIVTEAIPAKRKRGKSLSRRTGQDGHIEKFRKVVCGAILERHSWRRKPDAHSRAHLPDFWPRSS